MRGRLGLLFLAVAAFLLGARVAPAGTPPETLTRLLETKQRVLVDDLKKIERAAKDIVELREQRESDEFILNAEEKKLERQARMDFHIFMERSRNNTLEVLAILDRELGREEYVDPLRKQFGRSLYKSVEVSWEEAFLEDVIGDIEEGYGVKLFIKGDIDIRRTMTLRGNMTLLAILLQIENIFDARLVVKDRHLWFVRVAPAEPAGPKSEK